MSRNDKLLMRLLEKPKDFNYDELKKLLSSVGCFEDSRGRTSGSRVAFVHAETGTILRLHKPHPNNELKLYQIQLVIEFLENLGVMQ